MYHSANQSLANATVVPILLDTDRHDDDNMHYTSAANLTGTVAKTATSATLVGTGTLFTTELSVGQVISVPGTAAELRVVTAIASDTSLTVSAAFTYTASGQTGTRNNGCIVIRTPGVYVIAANVEFAGNTTGQRLFTIRHENNSLGSVDIVRTSQTAVSNLGIETRMIGAHVYRCAQWDFFQVYVWQNSGGALNLMAAPPYSPEFAAVWVGN